MKNTIRLALLLVTASGCLQSSDNEGTPRQQQIAARPSLAAANRPQPAIVAAPSSEEPRAVEETRNAPTQFNEPRKHGLTSDEQLTSLFEQIIDNGPSIDDYRGKDELANRKYNSKLPLAPFDGLTAARLVHVVRHYRPVIVTKRTDVDSVGTWVRMRATSMACHRRPTNDKGWSGTFGKAFNRKAMAFVAYNSTSTICFDDGEDIELIGIVTEKWQFTADNGMTYPIPTMAAISVTRFGVLALAERTIPIER